MAKFLLAVIVACLLIVCSQAYVTPYGEQLRDEARQYYYPYPRDLGYFHDPEHPDPSLKHSRQQSSYRDELKDEERSNPKSYFDLASLLGYGVGAGSRNAANAPSAGDDTEKLCADSAAKQPERVVAPKAVKRPKFVHGFRDGSEQSSVFARSIDEAISWIIVSEAVRLTKERVFDVADMCYYQFDVNDCSKTQSKEARSHHRTKKSPYDGGNYKYRYPSYKDDYYSRQRQTPVNYNQMQYQEALASIYNYLGSLLASPGDGNGDHESNRKNEPSESQTAKDEVVDTTLTETDMERVRLGMRSGSEIKSVFSFLTDEAVSWLVVSELSRLSSKGKTTASDLCYVKFLTNLCDSSPQTRSKEQLAVKEKEVSLLDAVEAALNHMDNAAEDA